MRQVNITHTITVAASDSYQIWAKGKGDKLVTLATFAEIQPGGKFGPIPPKGKLKGFQARIDTGGGWTFSALQFVVAQAPDMLDPAAVVDPFDAAFSAAHYLYDSGSLVAGLTASATVPFLQKEFGNEWQPFDSWLQVGVLWTTSAGAGTSTIETTLYIDDEDLS